MTLGSTVQAAERLGVSQPTVSRLVAELETVKGDRLFQRVGGRLVPRPGAEMLLAEVERALGAFDTVTGAGAGGAALRLAAPVGLINALIAPACQMLAAELRGLRLAVDVMSYRDTVDAVALGRVDLGLVKGPLEHPAIIAEPLMSVGTQVILPGTHPLAAQAQISPADLAGVPLILLGRSRPFRVEVEDALRRAGVTPNVVIETQAVNAACSFVAQGMGLTLANALMARSELRDGLVARTFTVPIRHAFFIVRSHDTARPALLDRVSACIARVAKAFAPLPPD